MSNNRGAQISSASSPERQNCLRQRLICESTVWDLHYVTILVPKMYEMTPRLKKKNLRPLKL